MRGLKAAAAMAFAAAALALVLRNTQGLRKVDAVAVGAVYLGRDGVRMQTDTVDCGVAALEMVFEAYGKDVASLSAARAAALAAGEPLSFLQLKDLAAAAGLRATGWTGRIGDLGATPKPLIAHTAHHFVVVDSVTDNGVFVRDPALGRLRYDRERFSRVWTGAAMTFNALPEVGKGDSR
ncbi:MAG TPA: cysteine peptidase family C39 domain-containing protein [Longimicrobiales bacterium]|nr:cysteine peptidase family C39 domain-containing protein [Longimicrobiales bacterium]